MTARKKKISVIKISDDEPVKEATPVDVVEPVDEPYVEPAETTGDLYWKNPIFLNGQVVRGIVTEADKAAFINAVKTKMLPSQFKTWKFSKWVTDHDVEAKRQSEAKLKRRKALGIN